MADFHLVRLGAPSKGDTIHKSTCRYAKRPNALRWNWAEANPNVDRAVAEAVPSLHAALACFPEQAP